MRKEIKTIKYVCDICEGDCTSVDHYREITSDSDYLNDLKIEINIKKIAKGLYQTEERPHLCNNCLAEILYNEFHQYLSEE
jgi:hypothetical protein